MDKSASLPGSAYVDVALFADRLFPRGSKASFWQFMFLSSATSRKKGFFLYYSYGINCHWSHQGHMTFLEPLFGDGSGIL